MSEQDVRESLHGAVAAEPPLSLDPDALVHTARREVRRRRALISVGVATTAIAVAAVAVPVALGISHGGGVQVADRPARASTTSAPDSPSSAPTTAPGDIVWPPPGIEPRVYPAAQLNQRGEAMRARIRDVFPTVLPKASALAVEAFQGEAAGDVKDGQNYLNTFAAYTLGGKRYAIGINVFTPGAFTRSPADMCPRPDTCQRFDDGKGGMVFAVDESVDDLTKIVSVYHYRADGSVTSAAGYNYDPTGQEALPSTQVPMPVTVAQLKTFALDPAIGL
ncbi:hypothetical protein [Actinophytocola sp.]|uniref:hypothetical protein n=1 Tax=Actinophytocola sp. TaxID=1872138 RepID=UPI002EDB89B3